MSISAIRIDPARLERLSQLEEALTLLQDPQQYARLMQDLQVATRAYREASSIHSTVEAASRHLGEARKILTKAQEESKLIVAGADQYRNQTEADLATRANSASEREQLLSERERDYSSRAKELELQENALKVAQASLASDRSRFDSFRESTEAELKQRKADLLARMEQLKVATQGL